MANPEDTLWELKDDHTRAKHQILEAYLDRWFAILGSGYDRLAYIDGFAGPGEYKDGEDGSPIIALNSAIEHWRSDRLPDTKKVFFKFVEMRKDRIDHLKSLLSDIYYPDHFEVDIEHGEFEGFLGEDLDDFRSSGDNIPPTFAFIDPFGPSGVPMELLQRFLKNPSTEVFTFFAVNAANRYKHHPNPSVAKHVQSLLGRKIPEPLPTDVSPYEWLRDTYRTELEEVAAYVRSFEMYDKDNQPIYDLFFAGNHPLGHEKMKEAMWQVAPEGSFRFSDATDESQLVMFENDPVLPLLDKICKRYRDQASQRAGEIHDWVSEKTAFLKTHSKNALTRGENEGRFRVHRNKADGTKRRGGFPDDVLIDFTTPIGKQGTLGF